MNFLELLQSKKLIGAHRGARSEAPENTLLALEICVGRCDFVEVDVQLSRDAMAVIAHDATLERTSDVACVYPNRTHERVASFTSQELAQLDVGSWYYKERGLEPKPQPLLSLEQTLQFCKEKQLLINIEIKDIAADFSDAFVVRKILETIEALDVAHLCLLSSFHHNYLKLLAKNRLDIPTAALVEELHPKDLLEYLRALDVVGYFMEDALVSIETVKLLRENGYFVGVYTVSERACQEELFSMGVNAVFSDII
ncbi:MAG: glycerophosphodiester phosphodiesterase [Helicobacteraceae bacterium]|nr:glycerophosphodiester phosphodiesterase [Helicobacteraceae bacterium]